jgi:hypothetical protein
MALWLPFLWDRKPNVCPVMMVNTTLVTATTPAMSTYHGCSIRNKGATNSRDDGVLGDSHFHLLGGK